MEQPEQVQTLDVDALDEDLEVMAGVDDSATDEQRDVLGELEITARLMITGGEDRMTRAGLSLIRQSILDAAYNCAGLSE